MGNYEFKSLTCLDEKSLSDLLIESRSEGFVDRLLTDYQQGITHSTNVVKSCLAYIKTIR
ncbi:hypothetical protein JOC77_000739 [Peribacillus deserti]|uniref:Uncharacterized protein n=1 Tax=Peribacillus deserti TaxID=673318 RepID=A0ABS2QET0_9BACI|nr:hypothetical protein [Peribacillus deserti]MBM7691334.1 hypothetical protein [Peribacillus deserti]